MEMLCFCRFIFYFPFTCEDKTGKKYSDPQWVERALRKWFLLCKDRRSAGVELWGCWQVHVAQCPCVSACHKKAEKQKNGQHAQGQACSRSPPATPWMWVAKSRGCRRGSPWMCTRHVPMWISEQGTCACHSSRGLCSIPGKPNKSWLKSCTVAQTLWHLGKSKLQLLWTAFAPVGAICLCQLLVLASKVNESLAKFCFVSLSCSGISQERHVWKITTDASDVCKIFNHSVS